MTAVLEASGRATLEDAVAVIDECKSLGMTYKSMGQAIGMSDDTLRKIVLGKSVAQESIERVAGMEFILADRVAWMLDYKFFRGFKMTYADAIRRVAEGYGASLAEVDSVCRTARF